ncbi:MAG: hypothetical protein JXR36_17270 [Bacteroidales bacterium]|nr:hypothetical protein [Bacteroidales bacterium]
MKKNLIKAGLILGVFVLGLTHTNNAKAEEQCHSVHIFCGDGSTNFGLACGSTYQEYLQSMDELHDVVCN